MDLATDVGVDGATLLRLYREMVRGRALEEAVLRLTEERRFTGFYHPGRGQEAVPAGVCTALRPDDALFYAHRGLTYLTAKGMDPVAILGDFLGTTAGSTRGLGAGTVHCVDPDHGVLGQGGTLGSCFPLAAGAALGFQLQARDNVAVAFFGDGTAARGTFLEATVFAVARRLPLVLVCENNGLALSAAIEDTQGVSSLTPRAAGMGLRTFEVDGYDVAEVHRVAVEAVESARSGAGPVFIEAHTRRSTGHFVGDLQPYRSDSGQLRDPIEELGAALVAAGSDPSGLERIRREAQDEMNTAIDVAAAAPQPGRDRLFEGLWAEEGR